LVRYIKKKVEYKLNSLEKYIYLFSIELKIIEFISFQLNLINEKGLDNLNSIEYSVSLVIDRWRIRWELLPKKATMTASTALSC